MLLNWYRPKLSRISREAAMPTYLSGYFLLLISIGASAVSI